MKKLFVCFAVILALLGPRFAFAAQPVSLVIGGAESRYGYTNGTVSLSSFTVTTIAAVSGYRQLTLTSPTSFFYRLDGSTSSIATDGFPAAANTDIVIETNQTVNLLLPVGLTATSGRYIQKRK